MNPADWIQLGVALLLALLAGLLAAAEAALSSLTRARADWLVDEGRPGAQRVRRIAEDPPRYLNTALFVRTVCEISVIVLVALVVFAHFDATWARVLVTAGPMIVISYVAWGVAPRTLGQQHHDRVACRVAGPLILVTTVLGPLPRLLILIGNALTPGKGFEEGPFATEAELRELVDLAERSDLIQSGEREMIHSVFDLGNTIVREVMVPRIDMVYIEHYKTLRQAVSLALRSGFSRIPVIENGLDEVVGVLYLKDVIKRVYDSPDSQTTERVSSMMRKPSWCPDSKPIDQLLKEMQAKRVHLVVAVDEFGGTAGMVTIEDILEEIVGEITDEYDVENTDVVKLASDRYRVSSRLPIDELGELFGLELDDEDVETVGGLMAKLLNKVPIAGSEVSYGGLDLVAERVTGRRNKIGTMIVTRSDDTDDLGVDAATQLTQTQHRDAADVLASPTREPAGVGRTAAESAPGQSSADPLDGAGQHPAEQLRQPAPEIESTPERQLS